MIYLKNLLFQKEIREILAKSRFAERSPGSTKLVLPCIQISTMFGVFLHAESGSEDFCCAKCDFLSTNASLVA